MKRILPLLVLLSFAHQAIAQEDYDTYAPTTVYEPLQYKPKPTIKITVKPYVETDVTATVQSLKVFLDKTKAYPELKAEYKGNWDNYVTLAAKYLAKGKPYEYVGNKKQMKHFSEDWKLLDKYIYDADIRAKKLKREQSLKDSVAWREKFVADSLTSRRAFVNDSLAERRQFVRDSLYRADYRKANNYDYVVFDGPHGEPQLCYRRGKIIDGKTYNQYGLVEKEYKGGKLIHDYEYSNRYLSAIRGSEPSVLGYIDCQINDKVKRTRTFYERSINKIDHVIYYNADGVDTKKIQNNSFGNLDYVVEYLSYYPDKKTVKTQKVTYYQESDIRKMGNVAIMDFFSDGNRKQTKKYRKVNSGELIIKEIWTYRDGYANVEYYDFDGNLERRSTEGILTSSWF